MPLLRAQTPPSNRQTAWACLTANVALPGSGSLAAGRVVGYVQVALSLVALALTMLFGSRLLMWAFQNRMRFWGPQDDPMDNLLQMWLAGRWALASLGFFALVWLWGLATGMSIVHRAGKAQAVNPPPRLN
jgi:hypothetical protein